jgi:hypothetical protein
VLAASGCASPETTAGRNLAETVRIDGYRKVGTHHKAETTLLNFVGPPVADLPAAISADDWNPESPSPELPDVGVFKRIAASDAHSDKYKCRVVVSTLRARNASVASELSQEEQREIGAGRLVYVQVACFCAGPYE